MNLPRHPEQHDTDTDQQPPIRKWIVVAVVAFVIAFAALHLLLRAAT